MLQSKLMLKVYYIVVKQVLPSEKGVCRAITPLSDKPSENFEEKIEHRNKKCAQIGDDCTHTAEVVVGSTYPQW